MEYHSIKWHDDNTVSRHTREVNILFIIQKGKFLKDGIEIDGYSLVLHGTGDTEHHLVEDCAILLKKIVQVKCGNHPSIGD
jgi:hypothetical protein